MAPTAGMDGSSSVLDNTERTRRRWTVWRLVRLPLLAYGAVLALLFFAQGWLIFPGRETQGRPAAQFTPRGGAELVRFRTVGGVPVTALFGGALTPEGRPRPDAASRPTVVYFYGNGTWLATALEQFTLFRRLGANVLIPEYVGYGLSGGSAGEQGCYATADAAYDYLLKRPDVDPRKIVAAGGSLGGAVAIDLAARRRVAGLAAFCSFTSMTRMAQAQYPWVPVSLLLRHRFESDRKIRRVRCPVLIGHGTEDPLVPYAMAEGLARLAGGPVTFMRVEGAGHNDLFERGREEVRQKFGRFLERVTRQNPTAAS